MVPKYFSGDCSTDSISCSERKKTERKNIKTRQQIKKGRLKRCCRRQSTWLIITLLSHRYCYAVALLSLCCRTAIALLLFRCRSAAVALLSHHYCTGINPLLVRCCRSCCRYAVAPLFHRYHDTVAPAIAPAVAPLSLLLSLRCRSGVAPVSLRCRSTRGL